MPGHLIPGLYPFGQRPDGVEVQQIVLADDVLGVAILTQGAILQDVRLAGVPWSLTLGTDTVTPYLGAMRSCGSLIGPVINRIRGATAKLDGRTLTFEANQDGKHTRHSGQAGTQNKLWEIGALSDTHVTLELTLPDGEGGFPGNRTVAAQFSLPEPGTLELRVEVLTDQPTFVNFANHSYWTLDGTESFAGHRLRVAADRYLVNDTDDIATGEIRPVEGSPFDFRSERELTTPGEPPFNLNFCLADGQRALTEVLSLTGAKGVRLDLATTEAGVQVYDGVTFASGGAEGHDRRALGPYSGLAIEAQGWPDAMNQPRFPPVVTRPGRGYQQITRWRFSRS